MERVVLTRGEIVECGKDVVFDDSALFCSGCAANLLRIYKLEQKLKAGKGDIIRYITPRSQKRTADQICSTATKRTRLERRIAQYIARRFRGR